MPTIKKQTIYTTKKLQGISLQPKREKDKRYATNSWKRYSHMKRSQNPQCQRCNVISQPKDLAVDHKIPIEYGGSFWNHANHWVLCAQCHNYKTSQERSKPMYESIRDEYGDLIPKQ